MLALLTLLLQVLLLQAQVGVPANGVTVVFGEIVQGIHDGEAVRFILARVADAQSFCDLCVRPAWQFPCGAQVLAQGIVVLFVTLGVDVIFDYRSSFRHGWFLKRNSPDGGTNSVRAAQVAATKPRQLPLGFVQLPSAVTQREVNPLGGNL